LPDRAPATWLALLTGRWTPAAVTRSTDAERDRTTHSGRPDFRTESRDCGRPRHFWILSVMLGGRCASGARRWIFLDGFGLTPSVASARCIRKGSKPPAMPAVAAVHPTTCDPSPLNHGRIGKCCARQALCANFRHPASGTRRAPPQLASDAQTRSEQAFEGLGFAGGPGA
jgi:hypothetical protein